LFIASRKPTVPNIGGGRLAVEPRRRVGLYGAAVPEIVIEQSDDPRLADFVGLTDPQLRQRVEAERQFFIAESPLVVEALVRSGRSIRSVLVTPLQRDALAAVLADLDAPVYVARPEILRMVVGFDLHRGAVASADRWPLPTVESVLRDCKGGPARRVAVLQKLGDHENLGGIFRNAAALGIDAVLLDSECADPLYRRCVRVSIGHAITVPWTRIESLDQIRALGFELFALTPAAGSVPLDAVDWPDRYALLLGSEGPGLSPEWLAAADARVTIPMRPEADSLNVATAAAIAFYQSGSYPAGSYPAGTYPAGSYPAGS
jgi:tRNA G18 (ribose-2'-O)-methylase SpoU